MLAGGADAARTVAIEGAVFWGAVPDSSDGGADWVAGRFAGADRHVSGVLAIGSGSAQVAGRGRGGGGDRGIADFCQYGCAVPVYGDFREQQPDNVSIGSGSLGGGIDDGAERVV